MNDIERQTKIEADAVQDGKLRYAQSREYQLATHSKPVRDLVGESLKPLADAILEAQLFLKNVQGQKMPKYGIPLLSLTPDTLALITIGTMVNAITRSEFEDGLAPGATAVGMKLASAAGLKESLIVFEPPR
jgi:hypothetical protein